MNEQIMTDEQIKKALECCENIKDSTCKHCCFYRDSHCVANMAKNALDLINRKDAEIERLKKAIKVQDIMIDQMEHKLKTAKSEAIKEFAERLKSKQIVAHKSKECVCVYEFDDELIDNLVAEMVGDIDER